MTTSPEVFRFVAQRPVQRAVLDLESRHTILAYDWGGPASVLVRMLAGADTTEARREIGREYVGGPDFVESLSDALAELDQWLASVTDYASGDEVRQFWTDQGHPMPVRDGDSGFVDVAYRMFRLRCADSLLALSVAMDRTISPSGVQMDAALLKAHLNRGLRLCGLLEALAREPDADFSEQDVNDFLRSAALILPPSQYLFRDTAGLVHALGVGDLLVVRQHLARFETGEIADITNVLAHESMSRRIKKFESVETLVIEETETVTESVVETSESDRFELQSEAARTVKQDTHLEAGATISAAYGPTVSFTGNVGFASNNAKEESERHSREYAHEVTQRASTRIQERVRSFRSVRTNTERTDIVDHGIDNSDGDEHVVGVYRWVDKIYSAQVYKYGQRLQYQIVVPEPAAFYLWHNRPSAPKGATLPTAPKVKSGADLSPKDLDRETYQSWVAKYLVPDVPGPPEPIVTIGAAWSQAASEPAQPGNTVYRYFKSSQELAVPSGYEAASFEASIYSNSNPADVLLTIAGVQASGSAFPPGKTYVLNGRFVQPGETTPGPVGELPVAMYLDGSWGYAVAVEVTCTLSASAFAAWQLQAYEAIIAAYQAQVRDYYAQLDEAALAQIGQPRGSNPSTNTLTIRSELQKLSIEMLSHEYLGSTSSLKAGPEGGPPEIDFSVAGANGDLALFLQEAFEWPQMTYLFYPYYWSKKDNWSALNAVTDPDPSFLEFLRAGSARVIVPVRPGYETAVAFYAATHLPWQGGAPPVFGDDMFVSLAREIYESTATDLGGEPQGEAWEVRVPTTFTTLDEEAL